MPNKDRLVIENVRNAHVIREWAQNRGIANSDTTEREIAPDDPRRTVTIFGADFHWNALVVMVEELKDKVITDAPKVNYSLPEEPIDDVEAVIIDAPQLEEQNVIPLPEVMI